MPRVILHAVGDVSFTRDIAKYIHRRRGGDYTYPLSFVKPELTAADVTIANLETTVRKTSTTSKPAYPGNGPHFSSRPEALKGLVDSGVDVVNLANNHIHDYGDKGLDMTVRLIEQAGLVHIGTQVAPSRILNVKGVRIGCVGMSRPFAKLRNSEVNVVNPARIGPMLAQIRALRKQVDVVIVNIHWGTEYALRSNAQQQRLARAFVAHGADVVIGHHPHVLQTMETIHTNSRQGTVFYSLGNFLFDSHVPTPGVRNTVILRIVIDKRINGYVNIAYKYLPCVIHPERGYVPVPSATRFQSVYPKQVTKEAEALDKYIECARKAGCRK